MAWLAHDFAMLEKCENEPMIGPLPHHYRSFDMILSCCQKDATKLEKAMENIVIAPNFLNKRAFQVRQLSKYMQASNKCTILIMNLCFVYYELNKKLTKKIDSTTIHNTRILTPASFHLHIQSTLEKSKHLQASNLGIPLQHINEYWNTENLTNGECRNLSNNPWLVFGASNTVDIFETSTKININKIFDLT